MSVNTDTSMQTALVSIESRKNGDWNGRESHISWIFLSRVELLHTFTLVTMAEGPI